LCRHAPGDRWIADETYVKVAGRWTYLYRAIDQHGQVITCCCPHGATWPLPGGSSSGRCARPRSRPRSPPTGAPAYPRVLDKLMPLALHTVERYANNPIETDHGRLKARLRPMRGLKRRRSARIIRRRARVRPESAPRPL
jgi:IS6 family transposase